MVDMSEVEVYQFLHVGISIGGDLSLDFTLLSSTVVFTQVGGDLAMLGEFAFLSKLRRGNNLGPMLVSNSKHCLDRQVKELG